LDTNKDIAEKTERKLLEQNQEFNTLRDRCLVVSGFGIANATAFFTFWDRLKAPFTHVLAAMILVSMFSIAIMIYTAFSNPLNRGMNVSKLRETIKNGEDYYLNEIAYNLESFNDNIPILKKLQYKLNIGLTVQTVIVIVAAICIYINQIQHG
jgi:hypothetical protein